MSSPAMLLTEKRQSLEVLAERLVDRSRGNLEVKRQRIVLQRERLALLNPMNLLRRGYGIVRSGDGKLLPSVSGVKTGDDIMVRLSDGEINAVVRAVN